MMRECLQAGKWHFSVEHYQLVMIYQMYLGVFLTMVPDFCTWEMAPPAFDITFVCLLSLDSEVRLPSIESSTLSPAKFSFSPKYWPVAVLLCLWDLTRLEDSLACLRLDHPASRDQSVRKQQLSKGSYLAALILFALKEAITDASFQSMVVRCIFPGLSIAVGCSCLPSMGISGTWG